MFIKRTRSKNFIYLSLAETYRENGKVKHRVIKNLGRLDRIKDADEINRLVASLKAINYREPYVGLSELREVDRLNWGAVAVCRALWRELELDRAMDKTPGESKLQFDLKGVVFLEVISRLVKPCSKLRLFQMQNYFYDTPEVELQHLYRALNHLSKAKDLLEQHLFRRRRVLNRLEVDLVFYDVTTIYFESVKPDELKNFGYSKDCKFGEVQVVLGMLVGSDGQPISCEIYPGNTFESKTLENALTGLRKRFDVRHVIVVADRGINSKLNLKAIKDAGFDYLVGCKLRGMKKSIQEEALDRSKYETIYEEEEKVLKCYQMDYTNVVATTEANGLKRMHELKEKLYCFWSSSRVEKDRKDRERLVEKAQQIVEKPASYERKTGARRYIKKSKGTKENKKLDVDRIERDEKWDGFYAIESSKSDLSPGDVRAAYHTLWRIEESFRVLKTNLEIRPVFHWTEERIRGHVVVCFLAFLLERTLELKLLEKGSSMSPTEIQEAMLSLEFSKVAVGDTSYHLNSRITEGASQLLDAVGLPHPPNLCAENEFTKYLEGQSIMAAV